MKFTGLAIVLAMTASPAAAFAPSMGRANLSPFGVSNGGRPSPKVGGAAAAVFGGVPTSTGASASSTSLNYSVGIVGATGAVGKEIRDCLEDRGKLPVDKLRIFGSERSAGSLVETKSHGKVQVELFSEKLARECDLIFLAVDGAFALQHAKNICAGEDGPVVIDSSVRIGHRRRHFMTCHY